ncbi:MAG: phosphoribosylglycinamide formyltransferase [Candidatus Thorarchaeota archaeon]|nr:phosphoribosylglycinamide formyltransferase [Candidatus Thorarchaeota archaeon]
MSRVGVLISGRGSNLQALVDAEARDELGGEIVVVISNKSEAFGLQRAKNAGIQTYVVSKRDYPIREEHDQRIVDILKDNQVDLVVLAGYMRVLTDVFISEFENRIINVHPALLPAFKGLDAQLQALDHGVRYSGCTTHFVNLEMDDGPIILQAVVPVQASDTGEVLADRILPEEHKILVDSVRLFCNGRLKVEGRKVLIREG